jgi:hypothetical protein
MVKSKKYQPTNSFSQFSNKNLPKSFIIQEKIFVFHNPDPETEAKKLRHKIQDHEKNLKN